MKKLVILSTRLTAPEDEFFDHTTWYGKGYMTVWTSSDIKEGDIVQFQSKFGGEDTTLTKRVARAYSNISPKYKYLIVTNEMAAPFNTLSIEESAFHQPIPTVDLKPIELKY